MDKEEKEDKEKEVENQTNVDGSEISNSQIPYIQ